MAGGVFLSNTEPSTVRTVRYGSLWPEGHFGRDIANGFADAIALGTGGRIRVELTPPSPDDALTAAVINGDLEMTSGHAIQDHVPEFGLGYLPYLYRSFDDYQRIWSLGSPVSDSMAVHIERRAVPVVALGYSIIGFRDLLVSDRRIDHLADFRGLRVRFDGATTSRDTYAAFGATPHYVPYLAARQALCDGEIDAASNTAFNLIYLGWGEVAKHLHLTSHQLLTNIEVVNRDFWTLLSPADQNLFRSEMAVACARFCATAKAKREEAISELADVHGVRIHRLSPELIAQLTAAVQPLTRKFIREFALQTEFEAVISAQTFTTLDPTTLDPTTLDHDPPDGAPQHETPPDGALPDGAPQTRVHPTTLHPTTKDDGP